MKLPHLTQVALLDRGQAGLVHHALGLVQRELLYRNPDTGQRLSTTEALSLKVVARLLTRLARLKERDRAPQPPPPAPRPGSKRPPRRKAPKPHRFRLEYDELATVRYYYARMLATAAHNPQLHCLLATALGKFHQPSLSLEGHITLHPPLGPGAQHSFFTS